jgi:hypothetical protein
VPDDPPATPASLVGLLAGEARLRVVAALVLGARTTGEVRAATGLGPRELAAALHRLGAGGLVSTVDGELRLHAGVFGQAARAAGSAGPGRADPAADHGGSDPRAAAVLRAFAPAGRLVQMPAAASKRRIVLEHIAAAFEPGVRYPEPEVNALLRRWYDDYASLRRYLVDEGLLARDSGLYWRTGGWVDTGGAAATGSTPDGRGQAEAGPAVREQRLAAYALVEGGDRVLLTRLSRGGRCPAAGWTSASGRWTRWSARCTRRPG